MIRFLCGMVLAFALQALGNHVSEIPGPPPENIQAMACRNDAPRGTVFFPKAFRARCAVG